MDLRQLRYFIALTEYRSFVRAADAMGITQPAFSRAIQGLEQVLGCALVDRGSKNLQPTPEGQVVLQHARRLVQGAAQLSNEVLQMTKLDAGELHFGSGPALAVRLVPEALQHFIAAHPGIRTALLVDNAERLGQALRREQIEFFVDDIRPFEADPNFHTEPLTPRPGLFFCRPGHPLLAKDSLSTNDLFAYPLASALLVPGVRKRLANLSGRNDFTPHLQTEHLAVLRSVVLASDAIGSASEEAVAEDLATGRLVRLHWRNLPPGLEVLSVRCGVVSRSGYRLSPAARAMIETLLQLDTQSSSTGSSARQGNRQPRHDHSPR
ncbi:LysR family transcriptional regulator [Pseudomonas sp. S 311-6]|uniref:LysR family transcriptional regulator n=1 Tax=Pseudomonas TaxID=286 RepID=UPI001CE43E39|nr:MULTISPECIES: LysR family transcriptional regulator [Pseudomonas]MCO7635435.1 LysR family transcriptional regulator [Pseudomonas sp. S 311-6]MCO7566339.1 LysR family transcriptional regulator [Pseudomonas mosselii]MCO7595204.1 LysR family transcriptional regulator [Pseudomonas guariconensis]MCO7617345.1 LysR family transcriptional regulator [Pseudomonas guariconensis]MCU7220980.1 LysR family transcriptional regulator [Pseudomonas brassicacearum]